MLRGLVVLNMPGTVWLKIYFSETNEVFVHGRQHYRIGSDLLSKPWHELIIPVHTFHGWIPLHHPFRIYRHRIQQQLPAFQGIKQKPHFPAGIKNIVAQEDVWIVIVLCLSNEIRPIQLCILVETHDDHILGVMPGHRGSPSVPGIHPSVVIQAAIGRVVPPGIGTEVVKAIQIVPPVPARLPGWSVI